MGQSLTYEPIKLIVPKTGDVREFFSKTQPNSEVIDTLPSQLEELFLLRNPKFRFNKEYSEPLSRFIESYKKKTGLERAGEWFYFPWHNKIVRFLPEKEYLEVRTGRNHNLLTKQEQLKYYRAKIGVLGMSVGSHVALTIAMTGGAKEIRIADPDTISASNLNRIRTGAYEIGVKKVVSVARQIYDINPYSIVKVFSEGIDENNVEEFLGRGGKLDVLVEEMDNPFLKLRVREYARKMRIPVIMAADNADGIIVDVERFDKHPKAKILHGILGNLTAEDFQKLAPQDLPKAMAKIAGANLSTVRMLESVIEVGKTLYSWPQLGNAATLCGSILTFVAKKIVLGEKVKEGRFPISPETLIAPMSPREERKRNKLLQLLMNS